MENCGLDRSRDGGEKPCQSMWEWWRQLNWRGLWARREEAKFTVSTTGNWSGKVRRRVIPGRLT